MREMDGGPAFPCEDPTSSDPQEGMSLRDYFAAKAMNGILAGDDTMDDASKLARWAYEIADAMIAHRLK